MSASVSVWFEFVVCVVLIGVAGARLSRYGDVIAEKTGMGGTWIGLILLGIYLLNSYVLYTHGG